MSNVISPLSWWRLPFASALVLHGAIIKRCHLCQTNLCQSKAIANMPRQCNPHWFNRLRYLCQDCHERITWCQATFHIDLPNQSTTIKGIASTSYTFPFDEAMRRYKNSQQLTALPVLIHALRQLPPPARCYANNSVILPVPTTAARIKERGFSPLWWLALYLSFHWQIPIFNGITREDRAHQQGLNREERLKNVKQAFHFDTLPPVKNIIVFDDVVTTGATLSEIINTLSQGLENYNIFGYCLLHGKS